MTNSIEMITDDNFSSSIQTGTTLVDFFAEWCGPCRMMTPVLEKVAQQLHGKAKIAKLDIDTHQKTAAQYQVTSVPTLILFKEGKEAGRLVGIHDEKAIIEFIQK